jgi:hypothetical protein
MKTKLKRWLLLYQAGAGLCDAGTGALLIATPAWTFHLMGLHVLPQPVAFVRFIGVFVGCVGLSYLWAAVAWPMPEWRGQWSVTALIRSGVALLVGCQIAAGAMEAGWLGVVLTDAFFAAFQWIGISRGWLRRADGR